MCIVSVALVFALSILGQDGHEAVDQAQLGRVREVAVLAARGYPRGSRSSGIGIGRGGIGSSCSCVCAAGRRGRRARLRGKGGIAGWAGGRRVCFHVLLLLLSF